MWGYQELAVTLAELGRPATSSTCAGSTNTPAHARSESRTRRSHAQPVEELARLFGDDDVSLLLEQV